MKGEIEMEEKKFNLRIDEDLLNKVKEEAKADKRSINNEIKFILDYYLSNR